MRHPLVVILVASLIVRCSPASQTSDRTVAFVMDSVIARLYRTVSPTLFDKIDDPFILRFLSDQEKRVLATRYQYFTVNVPVTVSLMRDSDQRVIPFWIKDSGFTKTAMVIRNEVSTYEVWEKNFDAGLVSLGINGFDKHRPVYFITVRPQQANDKLLVTDFFPANYPLDTLRVGSFIYHDWSDLLLNEVPASMVGQILFTTVRGRAREAHVIGGFRETPFPSGEYPDQTTLTWSGDPQTTMDVQWRTNTSTEEGSVRYWKEGATDTLLEAASLHVIQDRLLFNDRYIHHFTAHVADLIPGSTYFYQTGSVKKGAWSHPEYFHTEKKGATAFSFVWFGDTHCLPDSGRLVMLAEKQNQDASFYSIAGDIVSTGLYRDDWDKFFQYSGGAFSRKPVMPVPGNHDRQDGLGAQLYYDLFSLPENGPDAVAKESSYSFEYGNALFVMIDATSEVDDHTGWLDETLSTSKAAWKFVMFHFPPYNFEEPYKDIQQAWVPLFDKYHVDMVMGGHIHYYMRSRPMFDGAVTDGFDKGTVYVSSISIPNKHTGVLPESYAVTQYSEGYFYQRIEIDGNRFHYSAVDDEGRIKDEFVIRK